MVESGVWSIKKMNERYDGLSETLSICLIAAATATEHYFAVSFTHTQKSNNIHVIKFICQNQRTFSI